MSNRNDDSRKDTGSFPAAAPAPDAEREQKLAEIMRRVAAGDTSVVSEIYWLQLLNTDDE